MSWWDSLTDLQRFFYYIAIPSTLVLLLQTIITIIGIGGDNEIDTGGDIDADVDLDMDPGTDFDDADAEGDLDSGQTLTGAGFKFFTIRGLVAFFTMFGWVGLMMSAKNISAWLSCFIAVVSGFAAMYLIALLFYAITRLQYSGNMNVKNALGKSAEVYLSIPPRGDGSGKVQLVIQEQLREMAAITDEWDEIPTGTTVSVVGVSSEGMLKVRKLRRLSEIK